jgi:universal stress protein A
MTTFKNILCAVDFSACSRDALAVASDLAARSGASLTLVHVWEPPMYISSEMPASGDLVRMIVDDADRAMAEYVATAKAVGVQVVRSQIINGIAWNEIVKFVEANPALDLVVMGTHGRTGLKHVLVGSVAEKVVRHARCAVLVIR